MSQDVRVCNPIRDFQYDLSSPDHYQCLQTAADIGMIPQTPDLEHYFSFNGRVNYCGIEAFLHGENFQIASLADEAMHKEFVYYGLKIGLLPSNFIDCLEYGLEDGEEYFSLEDSISVGLLLQGVEQVLREAFDPPSTQIEVPLKKNFSQLMGEETVTIIVGDGEDAKKFVIHKDLLMNKVVFFEKMFSSKFLESSTGSATLPEDSPEAFEVLVEWVYCSSLMSLHMERTTIKRCHADLAISTIGLAEKYLLPELGDRAMTFLFNIGKYLVPTMSQMSILYEQTPFNSKARIYAARTVAWALVNPEASEISSTSIQIACQHGDLLLDAITKVRGKKGHNHKRASTYPICDYHNHAAAPTCPYDGGVAQRKHSLFI